MGKLNSLQGSIAYWLLRAIAAFFQVIPLRVALWIGRRIGNIAEAVNPNTRCKALSNLRLAFGAEKSPDELDVILKRFYRVYGQNISELARLPLVARTGFKDLVEIDGREHLAAAISRGKGVIFLSMHSGNWEFSNLVGSMSGYTYNMVANPLDHVNRVANFLNELRQSAGCRIIHPGLGGREIIKALRRNEIVTLVADQGGDDGVVVPFFGRGMSMSTGAVRLALKYGATILMVDICRVGDERHCLVARPFEVVSTGDDEKDVLSNMTRMAALYEGWVRQHPHEYLWFYKTWKFAKERCVVIIDDGRTGHLRQSQSVARALVRVLSEKNKTVDVKTIRLQYRSSWHAALFLSIPNLLEFFAGKRLDQLRFFLTKESYATLYCAYADYVVSTGAKAAPVAIRLAKDHRAFAVAVMRPGSIPWKRFARIVLPAHDVQKKKLPGNVVKLASAPNLIDESYLKEHSRALLQRFPHLAELSGPKIGVLIGGDAKGIPMRFEQMKQIVLRLKESAAAKKGVLLITTSRRTPSDVEKLFVSEFGNGQAGLLIIANRGNVPEAVGGILGLSDMVVVSGESVSMVSEAATSGKPTVVFALEGVDGHVKRNKYTKVVDDLDRGNYIVQATTASLARVIEGVLSGQVKTRPISDGLTIENELRKIVQ